MARQSNRSIVKRRYVSRSVLSYSLSWSAEVGRSRSLSELAVKSITSSNPARRDLMDERRQSFVDRNDPPCLASTLVPSLIRSSSIIRSVSNLRCQVLPTNAFHRSWTARKMRPERRHTRVVFTKTRANPSTLKRPSRTSTAASNG